MKKGKTPVIIAVIAAVILLIGTAVFMARDFLYFLFAPEIYALDKLSDFYVTATEELSSYKKAIFGDKNYLDKNFTLSYWKYSEENGEKKDLSFDFSLDRKNKKAEFAADNSEAEKIEDIFIYLYDNEFGVNLPDFSDDYWVNSADTLISDYNKSALREIFGKELTEKEQNLSFDNIFKEKDDKSQKDKFIEFTKNIQYTDKIILGTDEYKVSFIIKGENEFLMDVFIEDGRIDGINISSPDGNFIKADFEDERGYFNDFSFELLYNGKTAKGEAESSLRKSGIASEISFESGKLKLFNDVKVNDGIVEGKLKAFEKEYAYRGTLYNNDEFCIDLTDVKSGNEKIETGIYLTDEFTTVVRKIDKKVSLLNMNNADLKAYGKKKGGEDITKLFSDE